MLKDYGIELGQTTLIICRRFNFTLAHEAEHWTLHRDHFLALSKQGGLFEQKTEPSIICRDGDNAPEEWQANTFADYLLISQNINTNSQFGEKNFVPSVEITRQLSDIFNVSAQAMQIKLNKLGLLKTSSEPSALFDKWKSTL